MPFAKAEDGVRLYYEDIKPGEVPALGSHSQLPTIVLIHGFALSSKMWDKQISDFTRFFRVIRYDMRGHGKSESPGSLSSYSKLWQVKDMKTILHTCNVANFILVGHSMGAYDALLFYFDSFTNREKISGLVLVSGGPGFRKESSRSKWNKVQNRTAEIYESKGFDALKGNPKDSGHGSMTGLINAARQTLTHREDDPMFQRLSDGTDHVVKNLWKIDTPTLIVVGEADGKAIHRSAEMMNSKISKSSLSVMPGGHEVNIDNPNDFNPTVLKFLNGIMRSAL